MRYRKKCTSFDAFGYPISLYYKGESHFNTKLGTTLTFAISLLLLAYYAGRSLQFKDDFENHALINSKQVYQNVRIVDSERLNSNHFDIMFGLFQNNTIVNVPPKYGRFEASRYAGPTMNNSKLYNL